MKAWLLLLFGCAPTWSNFSHRTALKAGKSDCMSCHARMRQAERVNDTNLRFSHAQHMVPTHEQCMPCHRGVVQEPSQLSHHSECFACHAHATDYVDLRCETCHVRLRVERISQVASVHPTGFLTTHAGRARAQADRCAQCHETQFCADCHDRNQPFPVEVRLPERVGRNFLHEADFVTRHAIEARSRRSTCMSCHTPNRCDSCHLIEGVSGGLQNPSSPHPLGWVGTDPTASTAHGRQARRNIASCASCHDQGPATNCIRCHRVGGPGGNPHPPGFRGRIDEMNSTLCRWCHVQ